MQTRNIAPKVSLGPALLSNQRLVSSLLSYLGFLMQSPYPNSSVTEIRRDGRMSRTPFSGFSRSWDSSPQVQSLVQSNQHLQIDTGCFLASRSALLGRGKGWLAQCKDNMTEWDIILTLSGISDHSAGSLVSQWGSTVTLPCVHTVISRCPSCYELRCYQDIKLQQPTHLLCLRDQCGLPRLSLGLNWGGGESPHE